MSIISKKNVAPLAAVSATALTTSTPPSDPVTSVFGRTGAVTANNNDYVVSQITGAAPLNSPEFTGIPTAPTPLLTDNSTKIATTEFVQNVASIIEGNFDYVTVGAGADYATVFAAVNDGKFTVKVISNVTETSQILLTSNLYISVSGNAIWTLGSNLSFPIQATLSNLKIFVETSPNAKIVFHPNTPSPSISSLFSGLFSYTLYRKTCVIDFTGATVPVTLFDFFANNIISEGETIIFFPNRNDANIAYSGVARICENCNLKLVGGGANCSNVFVRGGGSGYINSITLLGSFNLSASQYAISDASFSTGTLVINNINLFSNVANLRVGGIINSIVNPVASVVCNITISGPRCIINNANLAGGLLVINSQADFKGYGITNFNVAAAVSDTFINGMNLVASAIENNITTFGLNGQVKDSGLSVENILTNNANKIPTSQAVTNSIANANVTAGNGLQKIGNEISILPITDINASAFFAPSIATVETGVGVRVDDDTIMWESQTYELMVRPGGITEAQLGDVTLPTGGLVGGNAARLAIKPDVTTGATVCPITISANGAGVTLDNNSIKQNVTGTLNVDTVDGNNLQKIYLKSSTAPTPANIITREQQVYLGGANGEVYCFIGNSAAQPILINPPPFRFSLNKTYTSSISVADGESYNLFTDVVASDVTDAITTNFDYINTGYSYNNTNASLIFPPFLSYVDYKISVELQGTIGGAAGTPRQFNIELRRGADNTLILQDYIIKINENDLSGLTRLYSSFTNGITDPFETGGLRVTLNNTSGTTITLTGFNLLIQGNPTNFIQ